MYIENDQEQEPVVIRRELMSPLRIRLNSIGVLLIAGLIFWITNTLPDPLSKYVWIGWIGWGGAAIMAVWGFVIAQRREWWVNEQSKPEESSEAAR